MNTSVLSMAVLALFSDAVPRDASVARRRPARPAASGTVATIAPNDNRHRGGRVVAGVLTIALESRTGTWQPDGPRGPTLTTAAFAEVGKSLQTPGPMLRGPVGTTVHASIHNALTKTMWVYGMNSVPGLSGDSVKIAPGATANVQFTLATVGTYFYAARTDTVPIAGRLAEDPQLGGVIVVDPLGVSPASNERIFAITGSASISSTSRSGLGPNASLVFNGRSFPGNETPSVAMGDTLHWRFVNMTGFDHPLHLHGFYFRVDAKGDSQKDTVYSAAERRMAVTEYMAPLQTMSISFVPNRSGSWIFHCHFTGHIAPREAFEADRSSMAGMNMAHDDAMPNHMTGLVIGFNVKQVGAAATLAPVARTLRLLVRSKANTYGNFVGYSYALGGSPEEKDLSTMKVPGPQLELVRGERVAITVINQSHEPAAVHWHGIELESYADGVPGVSGTRAHRLPGIKPGDSLTVRFTPPRAGTFMYHSHSNEFQQISSGLYGALIVREPGAKPDWDVDRVMLISDEGPLVNFFDVAKYPKTLLNCSRTPSPIEARVGVPLRLRIISIRGDLAQDVTILSGDKPAEWRIVAKDGMPTTAMQSTARPAVLTIGAGEIYDVEIIPSAGATLTFKTGAAGLPPELAAAVAVPIRGR